MRGEQLNGAAQLSPSSPLSCPGRKSRANVTSTINLSIKTQQQFRSELVQLWSGVVFFLSVFQGDQTADILIGIVSNMISVE